MKTTIIKTNDMMLLYKILENCDSFSVCFKTDNIETLLYTDEIQCRENNTLVFGNDEHSFVLKGMNGFIHKQVITPECGLILNMITVGLYHDGVVEITAFEPTDEE